MEEAVREIQDEDAIAERIQTAEISEGLEPMLEAFQHQLGKLRGGENGSAITLEVQDIDDGTFDMLRILAYKFNISIQRYSDRKSGSPFRYMWDGEKFTPIPRTES